jgi:glycosyltransferase involved in cell wall biosynthesis
MKIGISARWLQLPAGGAREYTLNLVQALLQIDRKNEYVVFFQAPQVVGTFPAAKEIVLAGRSKLWWDYVQLPLAVRREGVDLFWTPSYVVPFPIRCKSVATVLDLAYFTFPESYQSLDVLYMRTAIPGSFRRASALLAISEHTKRDIIRLFPFTEGKVAVTYLAASSKYRRIVEERVLNKVRDKYSVHGPFIFYAGSISPRKACPLLLQAFAILKEKKQIPHRLVFTGGWRWGSAKEFSLIKTLDLKEDVMILGDVPAQDMPSLYNSADLFVYPSLYEGFGLPVLEAMACGCPVVCSKLTSLPEVAGDAALMVDPRDIPSLANAMYRALTDPQTRTSLIEKGLARAALFTWQETARKTLEVFERIARQ